MKVGEIWKHKEADEVIELLKYLKNNYWLIRLVKSAAFKRFPAMKKRSSSKKNCAIPLGGEVIYRTFVKIAENINEYHSREGG